MISHATTQLDADPPIARRDPADGILIGGSWGLAVLCILAALLWPAAAVTVTALVAPVASAIAITGAYRIRAAGDLFRYLAIGHAIWAVIAIACALSESGALGR